MKYIFKSFLLLLFVAFSANAQIETPAASPAASLEQTVGLTQVSVDYSRPNMRGRKIFGGILPYGQIWRTGANATTKITFDKPVKIKGQELAAGTYSMYSIPQEEVWEIVFYTDHSNPLLNKFDEDKVALRMNAESMKLPYNFETFTILIEDVTSEGATLGMLWENTYVGIPFIVNTDEVVMNNIKSVMDGPGAADYYSAAVYYLNAGKDINKAKEWMDKAMEMTENPRFWQLRQQSLILAKAGDKQAAIEAAKASLEDAKKAGNKDYIRMNEQALKDWGAK